MTGAAPVAVVTGSGSGLGRALATRFISGGYLVVGLDIRTGEPLDGLTEIATDITDAAATSAVTIRSTPLEAPAPASIVTRGSASASLATRQGSATLCAPHLISGGHAAGRFTLAQPTWVEITGTAGAARGLAA